MIKLPNDLIKRLNLIAKKLNKTPQYLFEIAVEEFIEDWEDCILAESVLKKNNPRISIKEAMKKLNLED